MKNYQVRLSEDVHQIVKDIAESRRVSIADLLRESLEMYAISNFYAKEGKRLFWIDEETGEKAELLVPGLTMQGLRARISKVG